VKNPILYNQRETVGDPFKRDPFEGQKPIKLDPGIKSALIEVAGQFAVEMNKSKTDLTSEDLIKTFRDLYSSLAIIFLMPEN